MADEPQELSAPQALTVNVAALEKFFLDAIQSIDPDQYRPQVKALALSLFDKYVQPYDIPRVPEFVETRLEGFVREAIPVWVDRVFDSLKKPGGRDHAAAEAKDAFQFLKALPAPQAE